MAKEIKVFQYYLFMVSLQMQDYGDMFKKT